jgi:hypothetical protein
MSAMTNGPIHHRARWTMPRAYSSSVADPPQRPRLVLLKSSCGHVLGVGVVGQRQRYLAWKRCAR